MKLSSGNQIQDGHHIRISERRIAQEIERNLLLFTLFFTVCAHDVNDPNKRIIALFNDVYEYETQKG
jgi:hypothetical protein